MAKSDKEALHDLLIQHGLSDPKWLKHFNEMQITNPDQLLADENKEDVYESALQVSNLSEQRSLRKLFGKADQQISIFEKVHRALEEAGLDAVYWSKVFAIQAGVITEQAIKYVTDEFYPHVVQFARFPAEKRALRKLLSIEEVEGVFNERYEKQQNNFERRKMEIVECLSKMKDFQNEEGKQFDSIEVQEVRHRVLECLQVPSEFWFCESTYESFISSVEPFYELVTRVLANRKVLDDSAVIQNASSGLVLKGVCIQSGKSTNGKNTLLQAPTDTTLQAPFHSQHIKRVQCSDAECEKSLEWEMNLPSSTTHGYCSTLKCFVVPVASCFFKAAQLKLSVEAIKIIKQIEGLNQDDSSMRAECVSFFDEFGSHACLGPFHFGGRYYLRCFSNAIKQADIPVVQNLQNDAIELLGSMSKLNSQSQNVAKILGMSTAKYPKSLLQQTTIEVSVSGGHQQLSVASWRNCLLAENNSWVVLNHGTEHVPVWEIVENNQAHEFKDASFLARYMQSVWEKTSVSPATKTMQEIFRDDNEFFTIVSEWNVLEDEDRMKNCEQLLSFMLKQREEVLQKEMDFKVWPTCYLSQVPVQQCLKLLLNVLCQKAMSQTVKSLTRQVVRPIDLENITEFPQRDRFRKLVFETDKQFAVMEIHDLIEIKKICHLASTCLPSRKGSDKVDFELVSHPNMSVRAMKIVTESLLFFRKHLQTTKQVYEDIFIVTLLTPFNYEQESNIFMSCFTASDMLCLCEEFDEHTQSFFSVKDQKDFTKLQAHLILLTIRIYKKWDVTVSNVQAHFKFISDMLPDKPNAHVSEILTTLMKNSSSLSNMEWAHTRLQYIMKGVSIEQNNSALVRLLSTGVIESGQGLQEVKESGQGLQEEKANPLMENAEYEKLFKMLKLSDYFPQKMTLEQALVVRNETLDITSAHGSSKHNQCSDTELYPFLILQKIMSFDHRCRMILTQLPTNAASDEGKASDNESDSSTTDDEEDAGMHPMDGLLALLHCADNFLRQDLMCRLATCQISIPLLLPNPLTGDITFTLWGMRTIIKQWKSDGGQISHELPIVSYRAPIVSFIRIGVHQRSKSHMINVIINNSNQDTFFHYDCDGGSAKQILVPGLVEIGWYFPSSTNNTFQDAVTFVNLHGDARHFTKQIKFLSEISFMSFVFLNEDGVDELGSEVMQTMSKAPGGLILLRTRGSGDNKAWNDKYKLLKRVIPKERCSVIKLGQKNEAKIKDSIREEISSGIEKHWNKESKSHPMLEECKDIATKCEIITDEDRSDCTKGKEMALELKSVTTAFALQHPNKSPKELLPLQSTELWHDWASKDKEMYRHKRRGMNSIEEYTMQLREEMNLIRKIQLGHAQSLTPLMETFLTSLLSYEGSIRRYYLQWLKMILDNLSRETLPPLHKKYHKRRNNLVELQQAKVKNKAAIEKCKTDMEKINKKLIFASFGLEHLLREVGQLYEAMALQSDISEHVRELTLRLPRVAAELLIEGYPLELMDGDAAHVPLTWVSAVLQQVQIILNDPPIITLSILGLQSTGKSTLLNTLFGVHFSVSAGRCTRGAFMQLVPLNCTLRNECNCDYFLLVDTEGLRAPELDAMQTQNHDNELAAFVIGLANLTVINIYGETPGDLDDILQTSVHAFLRMKAVKLTPGCHFVHQNVSAVMAGEKGMIGRFNFKAKLDTMTAAAAKEENLDGQFSTFNEVIRFNDVKDVTHFPSLWVGDPPMAPVNPGYSLKAITLKSHLVAFAHEMNESHLIIRLSALRDMLEKFWKAVLYENFVFSFKNTLESSTYAFLDAEYGKWSWSFQQDMLKWEHALENKVSNCPKSSNPRDVFEKAKQEFFKNADDKYTDLTKQMAKFFAERPDREILIKWKSETETQLRHTRDQLIRHAKSHCEQVWKGHLAQAKLKEIKSNHRVVIVEQVKQLVSRLKSELNAEDLEKGLSAEDLEKEFEEQWKVWIKELEKMSVQTQSDERDIKSEVQASLRQAFKANDSMLNEKQDPVTNEGKSLEMWGKSLSLDLVRGHIKIHEGIIQWAGKRLGLTKKVEWRPLAETERDHIFSEIKTYLESIKNRDFHPSFTNEILHMLKTRIEEFSSKEFMFTQVFTVDMALTVCGYALGRFRLMVKQFKEKHDPVRRFEQDLKQKYLQMFKDQYNTTKQELAAARLCCSDIKRQVKDEVIRRLSLRVAESLKDRSNPGYIGEKRVVIQKILERIGKELKDGGFSECSKYIRHPADSIKVWVKTFTEEYCDYGDQSTCLADHANDILSNLMDLVKEAVMTVTNKFPPGKETFQIIVWIETFTSQLSSELKLDQSEMCEQGGLHQLDDIKNFTDELVKGLEVGRNDLSKEFKKLRSSDLQNWESKPYDIIHDGISGGTGVAGCTAMCPFCHEPCSLNKDHLGNHKVDRDRHRPQCLGGWRYLGSGKMVLKTCPQLVRDNASFYISGTNNTHPYKRCEEIYPNWKILEESPGEASNYWKYVVAKFKRQLASLYSMNENSVDSHWDNLEWSQAIADLK